MPAFPRIDAIGVVARDIPQTVAFYRLLGFQFPETGDSDDHIEAITPPGAPRLMIDSHALILKLNGVEPRPATHSAFGLVCDSPAQVDALVQAVSDAGHAVPVPPWDAFWGQRYATVCDPDGTRIDLFAPL